MLFLWPWIKDHLNYDLTPQKAAELLTRHAFAVEGVTDTSSGPVLEIEVLPNRAPDCFSHQGIARELNALGSFLGLEKAKRLSKSGTAKRFKPLDWVKVSITDRKDCGRYELYHFINVKVGPSPDWLVTRLRALGVEPINNVVDATNYAMLDTGQPMHAFDAVALKNEAGKVEIQVRRTQSGESVAALDGLTYKLPVNTLVIASSSKILAIAGVKGATEGSITSRTTEILVESANFFAPLIYESSHNLNLRTDASNRFSVGLSPELTSVGLAKVTEVLGQVAGAKAVGRLDNYPAPRSAKSVVILPEYVTQRAGVLVEAKVCRRALAALGFKVSDGRARQSWRVAPPDWRLDIEGEHDLIEEILRLNGYDQIVAKMPSFKPARQRLAGGLAGEPAPAEGAFDDAGQVNEALRGLGFDEVMSYSLVPEGDLAKAGLPAAAQDQLKLRNALSSGRTHLRASLLPGLIRALVANLRHTDNLRLMESGRVFEPSSQSIIEKRRVGGVMAGPPTLKNLAPQGGEFYNLKGVIEALAERLGIKDLKFERPRALTPIWHAGRTAQVLVGGQMAGLVGELSPRLRLENKIVDRAVAFELDLDILTLGRATRTRYTEPPRFPAVLRDVSLVVGRETGVAELMATMNEVGGQWLVEVHLFDWYEDAGLGKRQKSLAFHLKYRHPERTLTDVEVDAIDQRLVAALQQKHFAKIR